MPVARRPTPDWTIVPQERKRKGVTLLLLWQDYKAGTPDGLQYSQFCEAYRQWTGRLDLVMRQSHRAGETLEVITIYGILCLPSEEAPRMAHVQFTDLQSRPMEFL